MVNNSTWIAKLRVVYSLGLLLIKVTSISCYHISFHHFIIIIIIIIITIIIIDILRRIGRGLVGVAEMNRNTLLEV